MKVMIATDGSAHAENAARYLARLPHKEPLELHIVAVHYHPDAPFTETILKANPDLYDDAQRARLRKACDTLAALFDRQKVAISSSILDGHPGETLVQAAESKQVDLLVLGAVGHSSFERILLGSVSDFVATHAKCSVLIVRNTLPDNLSDHPLNLCYGYDGSERCQAALVDISRLAWSPTTKVDLLNVIRLPEVYSDIPIPIDTTELRAKAELELQAGAAKAKSLTNNIATHILESNHIGDALVHFCKVHGNHLLLVGDTGRGILGRFFLGSVARYVIREGACSVWIGRKRS
jgi:nucleotide-binding universal stress UspA family protein